MRQTVTAIWRYRWRLRKWIQIGLHLHDDETCKMQCIMQRNMIYLILRRNQTQIWKHKWQIFEPMEDEYFKTCFWTTGYSTSWIWMTKAMIHIDNIIDVDKVEKQSHSTISQTLSSSAVSDSIRCEPTLFVNYNILNSHIIVNQSIPK